MSHRAAISWVVNEQNGERQWECCSHEQGICHKEYRLSIRQMCKQNKIMWKSSKYPNTEKLTSVCLKCCATVKVEFAESRLTSN